MTSVTWNASANGICYECDADDMVRSVHIVKIDCAKLPAPKSKTDAGGTIHDNDECLHDKKLKNVGLGLTIGGGAGFLIGIIMVAAGSPNLSGGGSPGAVAGGSVFIGLSSLPLVQESRFSLSMESVTRIAQRPLHYP